MSIIPYDMLLHPELLSNEQLLTIIHERHLKIPALHEMSREFLLEVFHGYCVPYAQRRCRDNVRGKAINKSCVPMTITKSPTPVIDVDIVRSHQNTRIRENAIKSPPDLLTGHMKRIKLSTEAEKKNQIMNYHLNYSKRKSSIPVDSESPPAKKERKPITWP